MMRSVQSTRRFRGSLLALALGVALPLAHAAEKPASAKPAGKPAQSAPAEQFVDGIAAIVNKDVITLREVREATASAKGELKSRGIQLPDDNTLQKQVLQRLIYERLERQEADRLGIRVDARQVDQAIEMVAARNKINAQQLRAEVEKSGVKWDDYRKSLAEEIRTDRLRQRTIDNHIIITDAEVDAYLKDQSRNPALQGRPAYAGGQQASPPPMANGPVDVVLAQILVRVPEGSSPQAVAELRQKAESILARARRGDDFASLAASSSDGPEALNGGIMGSRPLDGWPDLFVKAIRDLRPGEVSDVIQSGNGFHILRVVQRSDAGAPPRGAQAPAPAAREPAAPRAEQGPVRITQTHARHILIKTSTVMSDEQARQRLEQVRQRIVSGSATFQDMARQYSQDGTAPQGGDLGWVNPGEMVPAFEAAMNALQPGQVSQPIESPFGWHLILVEDRREKDVTDEVQRMRARQALFERRAGPAFEDWMEQLRSQAFIDNRLEKQERIEQNNR